jgi:hypothetical protein
MSALFFIAVANEIRTSEIIKPLPSETFKPVTPEGVRHLLYAGEPVHRSGSPVTCHLSPAIRQGAHREESLVPILNRLLVSKYMKIATNI